MTTLSFAVPGPQDAGKIARLHVACWREAYGGIVPGGILANVDIEDRTARWQGYLAVEGNPTFIARSNGEAAGFIRAGRASEAPDADGHIYALYVLQRFHRLGIGRRLIGLAAQDWLGQGGRAFSVGVLSANHGARAFYERLGASFLRPETYVWDGYPLDESIYLFENLPELAQFA